MRILLAWILLCASAYSATYYVDLNGKVDEATLALMYLVSFKMDKDLPGCSAWKSFNWDTLDRLHDKGLISNPHGKAKSVRMSDEGFSKAEELFEKMFGIEE